MGILYFGDKTRVHCDKLVHTKDFIHCQHLITSKFIFFIYCFILRLLLCPRLLTNLINLSLQLSVGMFYCPHFFPYRKTGWRFFCRNASCEKMGIERPYVICFLVLATFYGKFNKTFPPPLLVNMPMFATHKKSFCFQSHPKCWILSPPS